MQGLPSASGESPTPPKTYFYGFAVRTKPTPLHAPFTPSDKVHKSPPSGPAVRAERIALLGALVSLLGMLVANAAMSIGLGLWVLGALLHPDRGRFWAQWRAKPALWGFSLLFLAYALGGLYSADQGQWLDRLAVKLPFVLLPFAALGLPPLHPSRLKQVLAILVGGVWTSSVVVLIGFGLGWEDQTGGYTAGQIMATPLNHIRYSLLVAFSAAAAAWLASGAGQTDMWIGKLQWLRAGARQRWLWLSVALFLALFLHVLAVRSGLLALYLMLAYGFGRWLLRGRSWHKALPLLLLAVLVVVAAFRYVPTLQNRIRYARYDLERFAEGEVNPDLSDAKRIGSLHAGWLLFQAHPLLGVGTGDVPSAIQPVYAEHYPDLVENQPLPHNQGLFTAAALGLMGLTALGLCLALPWFETGMRRQPLFVVHQLALLSSMATEATLETQYGVTLYLVPLVLLLRYQMDSGGMGTRVAPYGSGLGADAAASNAGADTASGFPRPASAASVVVAATGPRKHRLTALVPTGNERHNIDAVLASVAFADERLVVDSFSTDGTAERARAVADRVLQRTYEYSASQKNWAIPQAQNGWVLLVDADERVTPELQAEIEGILAQDVIAERSFWIKRKNHFLGKPVRFSGWQGDKVIRLFRSDCRYEDKRVHAEIENGAPSGRLQHPLIHHTAESLDAYLPKWDRYSTWKAEMALAKGVKPNAWHFWVEPAWRFFKHYIVQLGILDGSIGWTISRLEAQSVRQRYLKLQRMQETGGAGH